MHTASLRQDDLTSGIMNDADRSAQRPTGKVLVFLCLKISFRQGLIGRRQPSTRVLSDKRLVNFLIHGFFQTIGKRHSAAIGPAGRAIDDTCTVVRLHRKIAWFPQRAFVKKEVALSVSFSILAASIRPFGQRRKADATRIRRP